jgi:hypothetical protein
MAPAKTRKVMSYLKNRTLPANDNGGKTTFNDYWVYGFNG